MRLICPNCGAQYEVPAEVIPSEGRDVQCSSCGSTWFQHHPDHEPPTVSEAVSVDLETPDDANTDTAVPPLDFGDDLPPETPAEQEIVSEVTPPLDDSTLSDDRDESEESEENGPSTPIAAAAPRRQLDPAVAEVLRQEAEQERALRAASRETLETQPELGLDAAPTESAQERRAREAKERMAKIRGEKAAADSEQKSYGPKSGPSSRRELLPDIEEINSTLRANPDRRIQPDEDPDYTLHHSRGSSFWRGFFAVVIVFMFVGTVYLMAPAIVENVPAAKPYMDGYVSYIDGVRAWLDANVADWLLKLDALAEEARTPSN